MVSAKVTKHVVMICAAVVAAYWMGRSTAAMGVERLEAAAPVVTTAPAPAPEPLGAADTQSVAPEGGAVSSDRRLPHPHRRSILRRMNQRVVVANA